MRSYFLLTRLTFPALPAEKDDDADDDDHIDQAEDDADHGDEIDNCIAEIIDCIAERVEEIADNPAATYRQYDGRKITRAME